MNFIEMNFSNPVLCGIFKKHGISEGLFSNDGTVNAHFGIESAKPPVSLSSFISLFFDVLEKTPDFPKGQDFDSAKGGIFRDTVLSLSEVMKGFSDITVTISIDGTNEKGQPINTKSVTKIEKNKN